MEYWQKMVDDKWETVRNGYEDKYEINAEKLGVIERVIKNMTGAISEEFDAIFEQQSLDQAPAKLGTSGLRGHFR